MIANTETLTQLSFFPHHRFHFFPFLSVYGVRIKLLACQVRKDTAHSLTLPKKVRLSKIFELVCINTPQLSEINEPFWWFSVGGIIFLSDRLGRNVGEKIQENVPQKKSMVLWCEISS